MPRDAGERDRTETPDRVVDLAHVQVVVALDGCRVDLVEAVVQQALQRPRDGAEGRGGRLQQVVGPREAICAEPEQADRILL